ncbi:hypothetical protein FISHEDRAFT_67323 [Fistulina hepatica ATCC 64428]|uniref:ADP-ribose 1''-phosphate phosphatase n=1 Tax=Fistulina hepatica ATCC 64428 TaxID=1128425 RepID=A0A0D7A1S3_9AGAR|nr:hypothetical protein FISHEDRAFT_67323 [Fistulina hepatica ATCC 64428]
MSSPKYVVGDLFTAPEGAILVHACNTLGSWGSGIALTFREQYPEAFVAYQAHCNQHKLSESLVGSCLIIRGDYHDVACLFTSRAYGRRKDRKEQILDATRSALLDLNAQNVEPRKELHACRFNSGKFGVPWEETENILLDLHIPITANTPE